MTNFTPREIVSELDRFIIGQKEAKKAVAVALRNRWRRQQLSENIRDEIIPKNILMIGPTGVGKTEIARRLAKLAQAPFIKVEATKFTEVGYVGRDVEQIIRDLVEISIIQTREIKHKAVQAKAQAQAFDRVIDTLVGKDANQETRDKFFKKLQSGALNDKEVEIELLDTSSSSMPTMDIPGMPGAQMGMINLGDIFGKSFGDKKKKRRLKIKDALKILIEEESDKLLDQDELTKASITAVEQNGIVFIDEIDKICAKSQRSGGDISREGVQRDLLPLIEGTTVNTKHGSVKTDHILFISSGAFSVSKPSDLLPELQGRLPTRVELNDLSQDDFVRILTETEANLIRQYTELLKTEGVALTFTEGSIQKLASLAANINKNVENIGARRLHTVLERLLEDISFHAPDQSGQPYKVDEKLVQDKVGLLAKNVDLSKFIL